MKVTALHWKKESLIIAFIGLVLASCGSSQNDSYTEPEQAENIPSDYYKPDLEDVSTEPGHVSNDSVYISGNYILFFGPSEAEVNSQIEKGNTPPGYMELIRESERLSRLMLDTLEKMNIPAKFSYTDAGTVCITMNEGNRMYFNRKNLKFPTGMILMDGMQPPAIRSSNNTFRDYLQIVKEYFVSIVFPDSDDPISDAPNV